MAEKKEEIDNGLGLFLGLYMLVLIGLAFWAAMGGVKSFTAFVVVVALAIAANHLRK